MILAFSIADLIRVPFGYLLDWLYQFTDNYGLALILFALAVKLILFPFSAKSKKSSMQMSRIAPLTQAIQKRYENDPQKANTEIAKVYKEEGVSMTGGCLWGILPLLVLFPLFYVIREPLVYMLHLTADQAKQIVSIIKEALPSAFSSNSYYDQLAAAPHISEYAAQIKEAIPELANSTLPSLNFQFLGVDLGKIPSWQIWKWAGFTWASFGGFLLPVLSAGVQVLSMWISQKLNSSVTTDDEGNQDTDAVKKTASQMKTMMWTMPLISLFIGYSYPSALSLYWLVQGLFSIIQDAVLTIHYRKLYVEEDELKRRVAAEKAAAEAERERIRAQRRAENPDGIMENTSKKKLQKQQQTLKEQSQAAARKAAQSAANEDAPLSGDPDRPYCKGRAYRADRYRSFSSSDAEEE